MHGKLNNIQLQKLLRLLDMEYSPSEIASEIGFGRRQFYRVYIPAGCPHRRTETGHIWINGKTFRTWYEQTYKKIPMKSSEAFCVTCKKRFEFQDYEIHQRGKYRFLLIICPNCKRKTSKSISAKDSNYDQPKQQKTD